MFIIEIATNFFKLLKSILDFGGLCHKFFGPKRLAQKSIELESSSRSENFLLRSFCLQPVDQMLLEASECIQLNGTGVALIKLLETVEPCESIYALCGGKGRYSEAYYKLNFEKFKKVRRIFSFEAIREEIQRKHTHYGRVGLEEHMKRVGVANHVEVNIALAKVGQYISTLTENVHNFPLSFGVAIVLDAYNKPKRAVIHWEVGANELQSIISIKGGGIEGVLVDERQKTLLNKLFDFLETIWNHNETIKYNENPKEFKKEVKILTSL